MFDNLQDKMDRVFKTLRGEGSLNEWHIDNALKEIRVALLEADVHFRVVKDFTTRVREKAVGTEVLNAFSPAQQVTKIVRDELQAMLGGNEVGLALVGSPAVVMMVGLQGPGKTTTPGKLAPHLKSRRNRPLPPPCDVYPPAAIDPLPTRGRHVQGPFLPTGWPRGSSAWATCCRSSRRSRPRSIRRKRNASPSAWPRTSSPSRTSAPSFSRSRRWALCPSSSP